MAKKAKSKSNSRTKATSARDNSGEPRINILVKIFEGVVTDVEAYVDPAQAQKAWEDYVNENLSYEPNENLSTKKGKTWEEFMKFKWLLEGEKIEGTTIFEVPVRGMKIQTSGDAEAEPLVLRELPPEQKAMLRLSSKFQKEMWSNAINAFAGLKQRFDEISFAIPIMDFNSYQGIIGKFKVWIKDLIQWIGLFGAIANRSDGDAGEEEIYHILINIPAITENIISKAKESRNLLEKGLNTLKIYYASFLELGLTSPAVLRLRLAQFDNDLESITKYDLNEIKKEVTELAEGFRVRTLAIKLRQQAFDAVDWESLPCEQYISPLKEVEVKSLRNDDLWKHLACLWMNYPLLEPFNKHFPDDPDTDNDLSRMLGYLIEEIDTRKCKPPGSEQAIIEEQKVLASSLPVTEEIDGKTYIPKEKPRMTIIGDYAIEIPPRSSGENVYLGRQIEDLGVQGYSDIEEIRQTLKEIVQDFTTIISTNPIKSKEGIKYQVIRKIDLNSRDATKLGATESFCIDRKIANARLMRLINIIRRSKNLAEKQTAIDLVNEIRAQMGFKISEQAI